jgi:hypothetical protein
MSDQTSRRASAFAFLRRHRGVAAVGGVALACALGGALAGGAISAAGSDEPAPSTAGDEVEFAPPPPELRDFAACMEDHGAVLPAPPRSGGEERDGRVVLPAHPEAARADCEPKLGPRPDGAELRARIDRHIACMREHGVDLPEPPDKGPFQIELPRDDPDVSAARQACDHLLFEDSAGGAG